MKYKVFFESQLKTLMQYRGALFIQLLFEFIPLIGYLLLWKTVYLKQTVIAGYTESQMITYYLIGRVITVCITPNFQWEMNEDIRQGDLVRFLVRPISYLYYRFATYLANTIVQLGIIAVPVIIIFIFSPNTIVYPSVSRFLWFCLFLLLSVLLSFLLFFLLMLAAFFITEIASLSYTFDLIVQFLSGALLPLSIFPNQFERIIRLTPFPYVSNFPINVFLSDMSVSEYSASLIKILVWAIVLFILVLFVWYKGLERFDGNGA